MAEFRAVGQQDRDSPETNFLKEVRSESLLGQLTGRSPWEHFEGSPRPDDDNPSVEIHSLTHYDGDRCCTVYAYIYIDRSLRYFNIQIED